MRSRLNLKPFSSVISAASLRRGTGYGLHAIHTSTAERGAWWNMPDRKWTQNTERDGLDWPGVQGFLLDVGAFEGKIGVRMSCISIVSVSGAKPFEFDTLNPCGSGQADRTSTRDFGACMKSNELLWRLDRNRGRVQAILNCCGHLLGSVTGHRGRCGREHVHVGSIQGDVRQMDCSRWAGADAPALGVLLVPRTHLP